MLKSRQRYIAIVFVSFALILVLYYYTGEIAEIPDRLRGYVVRPEPNARLRIPTDIFLQDSSLEAHPIDDLIKRFDGEFDNLIKKQTPSLAEAAAAYRIRRGRHPPPDFDKWFEFATNHGCIIIEDLFDQVYRDLDPFWGLPASEIKEAAASYENVISIRNGKASKSTNKDWDFVDYYFDLFQQLEQWLPDVDIPINEMDESRILVPWEDINRYVATGEQSKYVNTLPTVTQYPSLGSHENSAGAQTWIHEGPYWNLARAACPPGSVAHNVELDSSFVEPPRFLDSWPNHTYHGYVQNWTLARDPCVHPHLRNMHGTFVEPISQKTSTQLMPMFSGSKLPMNNDILLPPALYWHEDTRFSAGEARFPWQRKRDEVIWRGSASGGRNTVRNWTRFQRHRLISMLNGTQIQMALDHRVADTPSRLAVKHRSKRDEDPPPLPANKSPQNFPMPNQSLYPLKSYSQGLLPDWIRSLSNAAFTWLVCFPPTVDWGCSYTDMFYRRGSQIPFSRMFLAKYLPDVDGNSFSGRYLAFLRSNSLPIKATIYSEWHDDRLIPWRHFVPMDNTFMDLWAILEYLFSHDDQAERLAQQGRQWAEMVLRKEDMLVYVYRLMLEYARVRSTRREEMGWAEDMKTSVT